MSNAKKIEIRPCPFCGSEWVEVEKFDSGMCSSVVGGCPISGHLITREHWNRRYVCDDKDGKKVFAGDMFEFESFDVEDVPMPEEVAIGWFTWLPEYGRWAINVEDIDWNGVIYYNGELSELHITPIE